MISCPKCNKSYIKIGNELPNGDQEYYQDCDCRIEQGEDKNE